MTAEPDGRPTFRQLATHLRSLLRTVGPSLDDEVVVHQIHAVAAAAAKAKAKAPARAAVEPHAQRPQQAPLQV